MQRQQDNEALVVFMVLFVLWKRVEELEGGQAGGSFQPDGQGGDRVAWARGVCHLLPTAG